MTEFDFIPNQSYNFIEEGKISWQSPSNIALIKYWGKEEPQLPKNPSISFTLQHCVTTTAVTFKKIENDEQGDYSFNIFFEGITQEAFKPKIQQFFTRIEKYVPFLKQYHLDIETSNSFPHSSGIASSASGMSALALCIMDIERSISPQMSEVFFKQKASFLARLGSGSACRSIEGSIVVWGLHQHIENSNNLFGIPFSGKVHKVFNKFQDTILLVDKGQKQVSSTVGHNLMYNHPFAESRFKQANNNLTDIIEVLTSGNLNRFIEIVESEALTLHAMMMTSMPYFILMKPNTLQIINKIWQFRETTKTHICFTLDAGANVHILYPEIEKEQIIKFIEDELVAYCQNGQYICDTIGFGAKKIVH